MIQDLVLLGLLCDGPKHGYEIKKLIEEDLGRFVELSSGPIYYGLKNLEVRALVTKTVSQSGKRPERYVYQITDKGRQEFLNLLHKNFLTLHRPFHNLDLSLYFFKFLHPCDALKMMRERLIALRRIRLWARQLERGLRKEEKPYYLIAIAEHIHMTVQVEIEFINNFIKDLQERTGQGV